MGRYANKSIATETNTPNSILQQYAYPSKATNLTHTVVWFSGPDNDYSVRFCARRVSRKKIPKQIQRSPDSGVLLPAWLLAPGSAIVVQHNLCYHITYDQSLVRTDV